ncbi:MAG: uncharacterized protein JWO63_3332 [Frankiales bacterium]|jgi:hypothetical protein|nr:uncharacterized protein [Frankiales bacterium]
MTGSAPAHRGRRDNGLDSEKFSPVADVDPRLADHLLDVLGLREVPAYVEPAPASSPAVADRLYVASHQTSEAREVLAALASELGIEVARDGHQFSDAPRPIDPLEGIDTDAEFAAIVAGMDDLSRPLFDASASPAVHAVTTPAAPDPMEHFVPPPPPPIRWPAAPTVLAVFVLLLGIAVIAFGPMLGFPTDFPLPAGVVLILTGAVLLVRRLRPDPRDDSDDDGAVV